MSRVHFPARMPALVASPLLVGGLLGLPVVQPTAPEPTPVPTEYQTVPINGIDSPALARQEMHSPYEPQSSSHGDEVVATTRPTETDPYRLVAVTWDGTASGEDEVSAWVRHRSEGTWSQWYALHGGDDHAPDPGTAEDARQRGGTDPLIVPESDGVQVRVSTSSGESPDGLRVDLVHPGESPADTEIATSSTAAAAAARPKIRLRKAWGADERIRRGTISYGQIKAGVVHHTVNSNSYSKSDVPGIIRGIYSYHVNGRGWNDIGYNFLVDKWGRIWEGRKGGIGKPVIGAHTYGHNDDAFAMSAIGTYTDKAPSAAVLAAYSRLYAWKFDMHGIDPKGKTNLDGLKRRTLIGHRDTYATACPGDALYRKLPAIRTGTANRMSPVRVGNAAKVKSSFAQSTVPRRTQATMRVSMPPKAAGAHVWLQRRPGKGAEWSSTQRTNLNQRGKARFRFAEQKRGKYQYRVVASTLPRKYGKVRTLTVGRAPVTARLSTGSVVAGKKAKLNVSTAPKRSGDRVVLQRRGGSGSKWNVTKRKRLTRQGKTTFRIGTARPGKVKLRVVVKPKPKRISAPVTLKVRKR